MANQEYMVVDGIPVPLEGEKNVLEVIRKAGIKLPTFCYHSELSIYGACRMCMVEDERGALEASCSAVPKPGMKIRTNTERLRRYRKNILELLLANHCRDCTTCQNNLNCKLQALASRFGIDGVRFPNASPTPEIDASSPSITRDRSKCILCGDCVRVCNEVQRVGAIDFAHRGSRMTISCAFDRPIAQSNCVGCGQCAAVCPTGAIVPRSDVSKVWADLDDPDAKVTVQIAPAVRVALGREFGLGEGENAIGMIVAALRRIGFDEVFDTAVGADLTVLEESQELLRRIEQGGPLPLMSSCCPAWVRYVELEAPELLPHLSTCKSPMQMLAAVVKRQYRGTSRRLVHVAVMPCTAKKFEAERPEFRDDQGAPDVDHVITTQELIRMIRESGIVFSELEAEAVDAPFSTVTGAGVIFGVTGGVTEAVLRRVSNDKSLSALRAVAYQNVRGMDGIKQTQISLGERRLNIAITSGLGSAAQLIERMKQGERFDFVEVMACPGGCVSGAGQPYVPADGKAQRGQGLYAADRLSSIKRSEESPLAMGLYSGLLKGRVHELLHVHYGSKEE
ncbi:[FeFe] hydrogenase, group A [Bacillota bacterium Meth-B3]